MDDFALVSQAGSQHNLQLIQSARGVASQPGRGRGLLGKISAYPGLSLDVPGTSRGHYCENSPSSEQYRPQRTSFSAFHNLGV